MKIDDFLEGLVAGFYFDWTFHPLFLIGCGLLFLAALILVMRRER